MCEWDCEPALRHPQTVRISFAANRNLSGFLSHFKGCFQCWNANCGYYQMFAFNIGLFDASCSRQPAPPTFVPFWPKHLLPTLDPTFDASFSRTLTKYAYVWMGLRTCAASSANSSHIICREQKFVGFLRKHKENWMPGYPFHATGVLYSPQAQGN